MSINNGELARNRSVAKIYWFENPGLSNKFHTHTHTEFRASYVGVYFVASDVRDYTCVAARRLDYYVSSLARLAIPQTIDTPGAKDGLCALFQALKLRQWRERQMSRAELRPKRWFAEVFDSFRFLSTPRNLRQTASITQGGGQRLVAPGTPLEDDQAPFRCHRLWRACARHCT